MKVVILCGGMGTRLKEETEYKPKPMVEIGGKPIIWHIMKIYESYGYNDFVLALGYKGDIIKNYFLNYRAHNSDFTIDFTEDRKITFYNQEIEKWKITLADTGIDSMTGYRLKCCEKYLKDDDAFMLTYGDAVADINIKKLVEFHKKCGTIATVSGVYPESRFGDLVVDEKKVKHFKEKIKDTNRLFPINGGFFVFKKEFLKMIPNDKNCDLEREPMKLLTKKGQLSFYKHTGFWQCMDTYRDYMHLNEIWNNNPIWKKW